MARVRIRSCLAIYEKTCLPQQWPVYEPLTAPPVERIERAYALHEIRYSPQVRVRMPSINLDSVTFESGS